MAYAKNHSRKLHASKARFLASRTPNPARKIILTVIISTIAIVAIVLFCVPFFNREHLTKSQISTLAANYYENYFYPNVFSGSKDMSEVLGRYADSGLAKVSLRQLILSSNDSSAANLRQYCDENSTFVQFYPEDPFNKTSYRTEFTYSCNF